MSLSNFDTPPDKYPKKKNEPYETRCKYCRTLIIMNFSEVKGKWYCVNKDGSFHNCKKLRPELYGDKK